MATPSKWDQGAGGKSSAQARILAALAGAAGRGPAAAKFWESALVALMADLAGGPGWTRCLPRAGATHPVVTLAGQHPEAFPGVLYFVRQGTTQLSWRDVFIVARPKELPENMPPFPPLAWAPDLGLAEWGRSGLILGNDCLSELPEIYGRRFCVANDPNFAQKTNRAARKAASLDALATAMAKVA